MSDKKVIGILGGMGPLATADLFQKITLLSGTVTVRAALKDADRTALAALADALAQ